MTICDKYAQAGWTWWKLALSICDCELSGVAWKSAYKNLSKFMKTNLARFSFFDQCCARHNNCSHETETESCTKLQLNLNSRWFFFFAGAVRAWSSDGHQYVLFRLTIPPYERISETNTQVSPLNTNRQDKHQQTTQQPKPKRTPKQQSETLRFQKSPHASQYCSAMM